jgi:Ca2+-binding RTX toxin-like protein
MAGGDFYPNAAEPSGNDHLDGGRGDDDIWGHDGKDTLVGGDGDDRLEGGDDGAVDELWGKAGRDTFVVEWRLEMWPDGFLQVPVDDLKDFGFGDFLVWYP